ncbi:hypothetical protein ACFSJY_03840 [Thalassotalea euphylliae]|uniref:hypothetical protein n=1 Tax=Thalassotalea euphylliae TaxID=1655234 RepID=UPI00362B6952
MLGKSVTKLISVVLLTLAISPNAKAGLMYQITGDIVPLFSNITGSFEIVVDVDDLTRQMDSSEPTLLDPLMISPWFGYDVVSANLLINGFNFDTSHVISDVNEPATGGPTAQIWFEGADVDGAFDHFAINFDNGIEKAILGFHTFAGDPFNGPFGNVIIPEAIVFNNNENWVGEYTNVQVTQLSTPIDAPATLALVLLGLFAMQKRRS